MNRAGLVRGIQTIVALTLATFTFLIWRAVSLHRQHLLDGLAGLHVGWLVVAALLALQEGVAGGMRMFVLSRVLTPEIRLRTVVVSEFVLMFAGGITPAQFGAPIAQVAVLVHGGMRFAAIAAAELMTGFCTTLFFLASAVVVLGLRHARLFVSPAAELDWLMGISAVVFGTVLLGLILCATWPPLLKAAARAVATVTGPPFHAAIRLLARVPRFASVASLPFARQGALVARLVASIDELHAGFAVYMRRGKLAVLAALLLTFVLFWSRFAVAYFLLLALGIPTTPTTFVSVGPPVVQVLLVQTVLNFALYLSPTPGASGIAEAGSNTLMAPWVHGVHELPFLVLWRALALFLCMFVGGVYVFRYLGTDVLEAGVKEAEAQKLAGPA